MLKKKLIFGVIFLLAASWLSAQSLADLAKKEKERRAGLKGKPTVVVTNADLAKLKKKPAVESATEPDKAAVEAQPAAEAAPAAATEGEAPAAEVQPAPEQPKAPEPTPEQAQAAMAEKDFKARLDELAAKAQQTREMVELLTLKMNSLWQEYYNMGDVKSREFTQFQISETYDKLTKAEAEAVRAERELNDFLATARRDNVPAIWIK